MKGSFLGLDAAKGSLARSSYSMGSFPDGRSVELPVVMARGAHAGPTVYFQSGLHGDEVTGVQVLISLLEELRPEQIRGTIVAVPVANPPAYLTRSRGFAVEERGPFDMNRIFPGDMNGVLSERIVHTLFNEFVLQADLTIDLHAALAGCDIAPFVYVDPDDDQSGTHALRMRLAKAVGTPFIYRKQRGSKLGTSSMSGSIAAQADSHGKPVLSVEMGESGHISWQHVRRGVDGLINMLRELGALDGAAVAQPEATEFSKITLIHAPGAGLLETVVELGDRVTEGQQIATLRNPLTGVCTPLSAARNGTVLRLMRTSPIGTGAEVAWTVA